MKDPRLSRRKFMIRTIVGVFSFIAAAMAVPLTGLGILPALKKRESLWSDTGTVHDLLIDSPQERRFFEIVKRGWREEKVERSLWLVKKSDGRVTAFSPNCPHLGCGYRWVWSELKFYCPCHASVFDIEGNVISGPAPRALDALETKVEDGRVYVKFRVFQVGIAKKTEA